MEKNYENWTEADLEDLDAKFDALIEYLGIEFVFERISDGSDIADRSRCYARTKFIQGIQNLATQHTAQPQGVISPAKEPEPEAAEEATEAVPYHYCEQEGCYETEIYKQNLCRKHYLRSKKRG